MPERRSRRLRDRRNLVIQATVVVSVVALNLLQQPGLLTFDTKLDLQIDPRAFMERSLELWNSQAAVGELQNQATGYLFPLGPFFALGTLLPLDMWVWERLWTVAVMLLAYDGARRLTSRWTGVGPLAATVAGLAYALAPRVITTVGGLSGETLPTAVLPWTVLPLVCYLTGTMRRWTALVASAATVPFMGGQNATEVLATLVLPFLVLVLAVVPWRRRVVDVLAWGSLTVVASLWWLLPLVLLGRYSPPFLEYIESARNTTSSIGWMAAFRGADHWVGFLPDGASSGWVGGWRLVSEPMLVVATAAVAAAGLAGVVLGERAVRRTLLTSVVVGLLVLTLGSGGWDASPLRDVWLSLLDGPLAPFRNIHKFDPLVRLPISIGVGLLASRLLIASSRARERRSFATYASPAAAGLLALVVLGSSAPAFTGELRPTGGFEDLPRAWRQAASYLDGNGTVTRTLVLPASGFGIQTWGRTIDTPLQVLATTPWVMRNQTPLVPPATAQLLDSLEQQVDSGRPSERLAELLARMGITHVLVRNDLDPTETDSPEPPAVQSVLNGTPGISLDRTFGATELGPLLEVYRLDSPGPEPRARLLPFDERATVYGGSGNVVPLVEAGLLPPGRLLVPRARPARPTTFVTDAERRVERNFGRVHQAVSDVMSAQQPFRVLRARHDYQEDVSHDLTVARYSGISDVLASSSTGYADTAGPVLPEEAPWAALDGSVLTSWATSPLTSPEGQWIEVRFRRPTVPGPLTLQFDPTRGVVVRTVRIETDRAAEDVAVGPDGRVRGFPLTATATKRLRVTVTNARVDEVRQVRLSTLDLGGVGFRRALAVPGTVGRDTTVLLTGDPGRRACRASNGGHVDCSQGRTGVSVEQQGFTRSLQVADAGPRLLEGGVVATNGQQVAALFEPLDASLVRVRATSFLAGDPAVVPQNAFDGDVGTTWSAAPADRRPVLDLRWDEPRKVTRIRPSLLPGFPGRLPSVLEVTSDAGTQTVRVGGEALGVMEPVRTRSLRITLGGGDSVLGDTPFAVSELGVEGLEGLTYAPRATASTGAVCGLGPTVAVGGRITRTRIAGTLGQVLTGEEMRLEPCGASPFLPTGPAVPVTVHNVPGFAVTSLVLRPDVSPPPAASPGGGASPSPEQVGSPQLEVRRWTGTSRTVRVRAPERMVLVVPQSTNPGWAATLHGRPLDRLAADGWMQGWVVPAGSDGTVRLTYTPQDAFEVGVVVGLVLAGLVVLLAAALLVRHFLAADLDEPPPAPRERRFPPAAGLVLRGLLLVGLAVVSWPFAIGCTLGFLLPRTDPVGVWGSWALVVGGAVAWAATVVDESVVAPTGVDVLVAAAVGLVVGLMAAGAGREREAEFR